MVIPSTASKRQYSLTIQTTDMINENKNEVQFSKLAKQYKDDFLLKDLFGIKTIVWMCAR